MARRYGRNQRRAHRERIAQLDADLHSCEDYAAKSFSAVQRLENQIDEWEREICRCLGPYSALLPEPACMVVEHFERLRVLPVREPVSMTVPRFEEEQISISMPQAERMHYLMVALDEAPMEIRRQFRILVEAPKEHRYAMMISDTLFESAGVSGRHEAEFIAREVARQIAERMTKRVA